jgi:hypothetical protein
MLGYRGAEGKREENTMSDEVKSPAGAPAAVVSDAEKKAARDKRHEVSELRSKLKFLDAEMERHGQMRKDIRTSLEALGVTRPKGAKKEK